MAEKKMVGYVIIPPHIVHDDRLGWSDRAVYGRVAGLTEKEGYCYASNKWLGEALELSADRVSKIIGKLCDLGLMQRKIKRDPKTNQVLKRELYVYQSLKLKETPPIGESNGTPPGKYDETPTGESAEGSNTDKSETVEREVSPDIRFQKIHEEVIGQPHRPLKTEERKQILALDDTYGVDDVDEMIRCFLTNLEHFTKNAGSKTVGWFYHISDDVRNVQQNGRKKPEGMLWGDWIAQLKQEEQ